MGLFGDMLSLPLDMGKDVISGFGAMEGEISSSTLNRLDKIVDGGRTKRHNERLAVDLACAAISNRSNSINRKVEKTIVKEEKEKVVDYINMDVWEAEKLAEETDNQYILRKLSRHDNWMVRYAVSKNFETEDRILKYFIRRDDHPSIYREAVAQLEDRGYEFEE